jgi:hypothetical protein
MNYSTNSPEYAVLGGVPLQTPAWVHENLWDLWSGPTTRGGDVIIPGAAGSRGYPRIAAARSVTLELSIVGDFDWQGVPNPDFRLGLWRNVAHLRTVTDPPMPGAAGDGSKLLEVVTPAGVVVSAPVEVESFLLGGDLGPYATKATIDLVILSGALR